MSLSKASTRSPISPPHLLQVTLATAVIIIMLLLGETIGAPSSSRLNRMPSFYGKRSHPPTEPVFSQSVPNFGLRNLLQPPQDDQEVEDENGEEEQQGLGYDLSSFDDDSLITLLSRDDNELTPVGVIDPSMEQYYYDQLQDSNSNDASENDGAETERASAQKYDSSSSSSSSSPSSSSSSLDAEDDRLIAKSLLEVSKYTRLIMDIEESLGKLQSDVMEAMAEKQKPKQKKSSSSSHSGNLRVRSRDPAKLSRLRLLWPSKRGTLSRLPMFYGRRK